MLNYLRNRGLDPDQPMTVAIDEIQYEPNLPSVVKYLYDHYQIKFLLSGSSSFYLKNYFSESLAGRKVVFELFPLDFGEYLDFNHIAYRRRNTLEDMRFDANEFERLKKDYDAYIEFGGMPDVVLELRPETKREILNDILSSYINIDVRAIADFKKIGELQQLLRVLALRIGNKLDYSKLSRVVGISRPTLMEYLEFLEKTYVISRLPAHASPDKTATLGKKLYFLDNGLVSVLAQPGEGQLFENTIFNQIKRRGNLTFLSRGSEYEVDFILEPANKQRVALEVKYHPVEGDDTKLKRIAEKNDIPQAWIIGRYPTPGFKEFLWGGLFF